MALVATVSLTTGRSYENGQFGRKTAIKGTLAFDSSYPTGGETLIKSQVGIQTIDRMNIQVNSGYVCQYDSANNKVLVYYADNNNASDGPLIEVPNTTDLSSLTAIPFEAVGDE